MLLLVLLLPVQASEESALQRLEREVAAIAVKVRPSVVRVTASFSPDASVPPDTLTFSGVVFRKDGYIVTDAGGVAAAQGLKVAVGGRKLEAKFLASDRCTGVAVVKVEADDLEPAVFAEEPCAPGAATVAVGHPLGAPGGGVLGKVDALGRTIVVAGRKYDDMIQIAALFQPGDCGGFVADAKGRLIGLVHSAVAGEGEDERGAGLLHLFNKRPRDLRPAAANAVGFVTAAAWVRFSAERIIKHGRMVRGWLGLSVRPADPGVREQLGLAEGEGAEVVGVDEKGPARRAGLAPLDVLVSVDGKPVKDLEALRWTVARVEEPVAMKVVYLRNRERREAELRVEIDPQK